MSAIQDRRSRLPALLAAAALVAVAIVAVVVLLQSSIDPIQCVSSGGLGSPAPTPAPPGPCPSGFPGT